MKAPPGLPQAAADCMHQICEMDEGLSLICPIAICHRVPHNWGRVPDIICKFGLHDSRLSSRALIDWISEPLGSIVCPGCVANPHQACHRPLGWAGSTLHTSNETPFYRIAFSLVKLSNLLGRSRPNHTKWFLNADDRIESLSILGWVHDPNYIPYVSSTHGTTLSCPVAKEKTESTSTMQGTNMFSTISYQGALHKCKVVQQARHALDQTCHFSTSSFTGASHAHRQTKVPRKDLKTLTTGLQQCVFSPCTRFSGSCHSTNLKYP